MRAIGLGLVLAGLLAGMAGAEGMMRKGYEMPPFVVVDREGARDLRDYGPRMVAEVTVRGDRRAAVNTGFRLLAGYIFGANDAGGKIAMTVPVEQAEQGEGLWVVRFTMPAAAVAAGLPAPADGRIVLREVPATRMVVEGFSGLPDGDDMAARAAALRTWAEGRGLRVVGGPVYAFYDAPWTPAGARLNEVGWEVR
ncbi:SOUL family heme-binding protein [Paragemmobacter ruber]|uniref:Heme-binding protein n=1 Tax=Paragemmobacter ruber TaxID=1985673 RepID=A0ABW9Y9Y3_9RHOB|nr:heme-binding protein [Rhodobacter ruber]NBE09258.1 heme-binding protein [Rhodobacter ruber]